MGGVRERGARLRHTSSSVRLEHRQGETAAALRLLVRRSCVPAGAAANVLAVPANQPGEESAQWPAFLNSATTRAVTGAGTPCRLAARSNDPPIAASSSGRSASASRCIDDFVAGGKAS
ncbi:hypothetical protein SALBM311S_00768 [Streptomyces alboniger]